MRQRNRWRPSVSRARGGRALLLACAFAVWVTPEDPVGLHAHRLAAQELGAPRPIDGTNTVFIEEMTWMEVRDALREGKTTAIVATGGVEQNGPYVASGKHNFVLQATTEAIARELGNALVGPIVKFVPEGSIDPPSGHMLYHATISVRQETFAALLTDVVESLVAHGFENVVLIGDSGGNRRGMQAVADALNARWSGDPAWVHHIPEYYSEDIYSCEFLKTELGIFQQPDECVATRNEYHDDYHYSSIIATTDPERIRAEQRIRAGLFQINGVDLAPLEQTIENGRRLVRYRAEITARAIRRAIASAGANPKIPIEWIRIEANGFTFDARALGPTDGPLVFLLHGFPQSSLEWRYQMPVLAEMGFRVVAPDQRGYSAGARPSEVEAYRIPDLTEDVAAMADALGHRTFHVVGHDWGAIVAWYAGLRFPDRVVSLVPVSVPHPFAFGQTLAQPGSDQSRRSGYMQLFRADSAEAVFLRDDARFLRSLYGGAGLTEEETLEYVSLLQEPGAMTGALNWYRAMVLPASGPTPSLTPIAMPTLYVWSDSDPTMSREGAELTASFVEGPYRFEVLEGIGHWIPEEAAESFNRLLREHFEPFRPDQSGTGS